MNDPHKPKRCVDFVLDDGSGKATIRASATTTMLYLTEDGHLRDNLKTEGVVGVESRLAKDGLIVKWLGNNGIACFDTGAGA